ncbi:type IV secretory system conjugative DNA transfer family protein [Brevibacillus centrosporus]|uniref:VirD4-like conjugal transfer protein, CD1115 family n=1 Tax=Brevibacillus centrosporus TaxID=54910 RepID=UPI003D1B9409
MEVKTVDNSGEISELKILESRQGFYVGRTVQIEGQEIPYSKDSGYFETRGQAKAHLKQIVKEEKKNNQVENVKRRKPGNHRYAVHAFDENAVGIADLNNQYLIYGPPGSMKTTGFILPNIFHLADQDMSIVTTDPKGEIYELTANYLRERGYNIVVFDFINFAYGDQLNLLDFIYTDKQMMEIAKTYVASANEGSDDGDKFFENNAAKLLAALIGFAKQVYGKDASLPVVYDIMVNDVSDEETAHLLFENNNVTGTSERLYKGFCVNKDKTRASILSTLDQSIMLFALKEVENMTKTSTYDLRRIPQEKTAVFIWIPVEDTTFAPIITTFWTVFFNTMYAVGRKFNGKLPIPTVALIDEMANIGQIPDMDKKMTTMRSLKLYPFLVWHSLPQIRDKYGEDKASAIIAACDTRILLAANDLDTAEEFTKMIGDETIRTQITSSSKKTRQVFADQINESTSYHGKPLMSADEILRLPNEYSIVLQRSRYPVLLKKVQYRYWKPEERICSLASKKELRKYGEELVLENLEGA